MRRSAIPPRVRRQASVRPRGRGRPSYRSATIIGSTFSDPAPLPTRDSIPAEASGPPLQRGTRQRAAIRAVLADSPHPLLPAEILSRAQAVVAQVGLATVYRALKRLVDEAEVRIVELPGEAPRYESAHRGHHHHFQCRECARVFDVTDCPGDFGMLAPRGFVVEAHELTLYGKCADCAKARRKPTPARRPVGSL